MSSLAPALAGAFAPAENDAAPAQSSDARRPELGLDWFTFFLADIQAGFGPFVAVYLTTQSWTQVDIGLVLTVGGLVALAGQVPGGALVDAMRSARLLAAGAIVAISASAIALALWPTVFSVVLGSRLVHAAGSCVLGPAIAAMSLGLVGHARFGERLGRNARFASIGGGVGAAAMGACGYYLTNQSVFLLTGLLALPALLALVFIRSSRAMVVEAERAATPKASAAGWWAVLTNRHLLIFAACIVLFQLANAAMLPVMASILTMKSASTAPAIIAVCSVVPQLVVAGFAPWVGRQAERRGRRPLLLVCFAALALRGALFALARDPAAVVVVQALDGVSAAIIGVLFPLIIADVMRGSGRFNLALGVVGSAVGIGAAISTLLAGFLFDHFGAAATFLSLGGVAGLGLLLVLGLMPETRARAGA